MIKKWNQFNESKSEKPGENVTGSAKINLSDEDVNAFTDNPSLQKLISDGKVSLLGNEVWYWEDDMVTKSVMDQYLEIPGIVEEEPMNEEFFGGAPGIVNINIDGDGEVKKIVVDKIRETLNMIGSEVHLFVDDEEVESRSSTVGRGKSW